MSHQCLTANQPLSVIAKTFELVFVILKYVIHTFTGTPCVGRGKSVYGLTIRELETVIPKPFITSVNMQSNDMPTGGGCGSVTPPIAQEILGQLVMQQES